MKKNLLTVLILALLIVNIVLSGIMMFSVMSTNKKTAVLVNNIATVLNLELKQDGENQAAEEVPLDNLVAFDITGAMTIPLTSTPDSPNPYIKFNISFYLNSKSKDYKKYGETIAERESLIKGTINTVVSAHTLQDVKDNFEGLKAEILKAVQDLFDSDFVYEVAISEIQYGG